MNSVTKSDILIEAEAFDHYGGWLLDSQFETEMGSPYLLAHGNGKPVADAVTIVSITDPGRYFVWVRAKDWIPGHHPGRFTVLINDIDLGVQFGANDLDWNWESGGTVDLPRGNVKIVLHDITGFCGRCDAIFFGRDGKTPPEGVSESAYAWRRKLRGLPSQPIDGGSFDVVVVGGGVPGVAAALTLARLGENVALIHDRPYLGGNASVEIGLRPRGITGQLIDEISERQPDGNLNAAQLLEAEHGATVLLEYRVYNTEKINDAITSVLARHARTGQEIRLSAPLFIDCSGKCIVGLYAGAETLFGQESQATYGENLAPLRGDNMHHGNTVFFRTREADHPVLFPAVPWAIEVAKDFSDLRGQLVRPGVENGPGPSVISDTGGRRRMKGPLTHFWEYGQHLDPYTHGEHIRDHLLRAIYGTFSNVKTLEPETYANLELEWVAYVPAQGEFRRYKGDYVLTETDIRTHKNFHDAVVQNAGAFCLHYPGHSKYDFRLKDWEWDERDGKPYDIPFRSLYSVNVLNLMMAGKHMSASHVASSNTKFMGNGGQHAIATAVAAHLCHKYDTIPRILGETHLPELQDIVARLTAVMCDSNKSRL